MGNEICGYLLLCGFYNYGYSYPVYIWTVHTVRRFRVRSLVSSADVYHIRTILQHVRIIRRYLLFLIIFLLVFFTKTCQIQLTSAMKVLIDLLYSMSIFHLIFLSGFVISLTLRLIGGESYLNWQATVGYPMYDQAENIQYFPYKTLAMLCGLGVMLGVSYLTEWLMTSGRLDIKWLVMVNNQVDRAAVDTTLEYELKEADTDPDISSPLMEKLDT